jgi:PhnB protein
MMTEITVMLAVNDAQAAVEFYKKAFGAELYWTVGGDDHMVAGLAIGGARFFLATESPEFGTRGPSAAGFTTVRIELFVDDPVAVQAKAVSAGAKQHSEVKEHNYPTVGPKPIGKMLQGGVVDPFGHMWLIGKFLD